MRRPHGKLQERKRIEREQADYSDEGLTKRKQRKAIPPDAFDDLMVSYMRG